jgi:putative hydroxymethylpyrimidine transport system permease protein
MIRTINGTIICLAFLLLWQIIVIIGHLPSYILPSPLQVLITLQKKSTLIAFHAVPTVIEIGSGFIFGILFGCLAAIVVSFFRPLSQWLLPVLIISQAVPTFAIAPFLVLWLGYGMAAKIVTTIIMLFFPITSAMYDGLRQTDQRWLDLAKTMQGKKWPIFYYLRLPSALPSLASGIRIAATFAPVGALIGEWVGSSRGLGYLMLNANARLEIDLMFAVLVVIILIALSLYFSVDKLLRTLIWWE